MVTQHQPLLSTSEMVALYKSPHKADKIRAGKQIGRMSQEAILELKESMEHHHVPIAGKLAQALANPAGEHETNARTTSPNGNGRGDVRRVLWGEDEWEFLVPKVSALTLKEPTTGLTSLAARVMQMMPEEQRRSPHAGVISELNKRLIEYNRVHWLDVGHELEVAKQEVQRRKEAQSREEIIASLTPEEIAGLTNQVVDNLTPVDLVSRFSEATILDCLSPEAIISSALVNVCNHAGRHTMLLEENLTMLSRLLAELPQEKMRRQLQEKETPAVKPQVAFVGFKADQIAIVADNHQLRGRIRIDVIDKNRSKFDSQADVVILWTKFISHATQEQVVKNIKKGARLIRFNGGLESAAREIERAIRV